MSAREFGSQLLTRLLTYTIEAVPGAIGAGLSIATGDDEASTPHSVAAVGVATDLDRAQWSHATGPLWEAFRRGSVVVRPGPESGVDTVTGNGTSFAPADLHVDGGGAGLGSGHGSGDGFGDASDSGQLATVQPVPPVSGRHMLGLDRADGVPGDVADSVRGAVFSSGEWGGELPLVLSVYLDRVPDLAIMQEIDRHEPVLAQALAVVEYCAGEEVLAEQMVQMNQYRRVIEQAKGLVMGAVGADSAAAFETLSRASQHFNVRLRSLAVALVEHVSDGKAEQPDDPDLVVQPSDVDRKAAARVWAALSASQYLAGGSKPGTKSSGSPLS